MNEEMQELMQSNPEWYKELQYKDVKVYIRDNINSASRSFVAIGYYLKYVRDNQLFVEDGYSGISEFAKAEFGIGKSSASRFMAINDRFSKDGNSPILLKQYRDFSSSKLSEMLTMSDEQLDQVSITTTVAEIREIKQPAKEEVVAMSQLEPGTNTCFIKKDLEDGLMCSGGISNNCDTCDRFQPEEQEPEPSNKCIHRPEFPCTLSEAQKVAQGDGEECNKKCCWGCPKHGKCGYECNASAHRPAEIEPVSSEELQPCKFGGGKCDLWTTPSNCSSKTRCSSNFIADVELVETVEADIIQTEYEDDNDDEDEPEIIDPEYYTYRDVDDELDKLMGYVETFRKDNDNSSGRRKAKMRLDAIILLDRDMKKVPVVEETEPEQPELPILRNNDQRKEFIEAYDTWPIWINTEPTGERYYRYDFNNGDSMVVKVYYCKVFDYKSTNLTYEERFRDDWGKEEYYLLEPDKYFKDCETNKSALVDYLKEVQKKGAN